MKKLQFKTYISRLLVYIAKPFERHKKTERTPKAAEPAPSSDYQSTFLADMSHELRTPLNSILILARLLEDNKSGNLTPEQVKFASVIHRAGNELLDLINNILDLAKIESGSIELIIEQVSLSSIARDLLDLFSSVAANKAIDFRISIHEGLPLAITTDEQRLQQVLKNLLSNAFKFTQEQGRVELLFTPAERSPAWKTGILSDTAPDGVIALSVIDTGIGIAEDKQELIFERFRQADKSTGRIFGGTGLGLSICRELATALGGEICVVSQEGAGSIFSLFLPYHYTSGIAADPTTESKENRNLTNNHPWKN
ncbi:sensor histidine kinase [Parapedobacter sp. DT-150]|uniref:sensor histidine kinase n=1 Tax=Parapedobacter sp. DT-150 TaxID=3396162 RepID=UPI003F19EE44